MTQDQKNSDEDGFIPKIGELTAEAVSKQIRDFAEPIDFEKLIGEGILEKKGAWYKIIDWDRLPQHAKVKVKEFCSDGTVKFEKVTKSIEKLAKKLSE